jgi:AcrR family transcriptional regulator
MISPIKFATYLEVQAQEIKAGRSGKKSRLRLLSALARLLEESEFGDIKVLDITGEAGLAKGTFFIYFKTKEQIVDELMQLYLEFERITMPDVEFTGDPFNSVIRVVEWYEKTFAVNHGVLACLIRLSGSDVHFRTMWRERNAALLDRWVPRAIKTLKLKRKDHELLYHVMHSVGAIMDQSLFERYGIGTTGDSGDLDTDSLIELHSVLIYRAVYGEDPPLDGLSYTRPLVQARKISVANLKVSA